MNRQYVYRNCVTCENGLCVGLRAYENPPKSLVVFVTHRGQYLDPETLDGPPSGDDKKIISAAELESYLDRVKALPTPQDDRNSPRN